MIIISHNAQIKGPNEYRENNPAYIDKAIVDNYLVKVDIKFIDNKFCLGYDEKKYEVDVWWILERKHLIIFHCKNIESAYRLRQLDSSISYFCHTNDPFTVINNGLIWVNDLTLPLNEHCIIQLIGDKLVNQFELKTRIAGICTDYVELAKKKFID